MDIMPLFGQLPMVVQLALVIGTVIVIFLIACSRRAGENLLFFLQGLRSVIWMRVEADGYKTSPHKKSSAVSLNKGNDPVA